MAKKRRARLKGPPAQWPTSDAVTLLAWLDHSLKHKELDFETTVISRLNQAYTLPQINRKLSSLWTRHGPEQKPGCPRSTWKEDIFAYGSSCLSGANGLRDDILEDIARSARRLEDGYRTTSVQPAVRRLRSTSRQNDFPLLLRTTSDTPKRTVQSPQKQRLRPPSESLTPSAIKREIEQTQSPIERPTSAKKRRRKLLDRLTTSRSITTHRKPADRRPERRIPRPSHTSAFAVVEDSEDELSDILSEDVEDYGNPPEKVRCICGAIEEEQAIEGLTEEDTYVDWIQCTGCSVWQHTFCVRNNLEGNSIPGDYSCELCKPTAHKNRYDRRLSSHTVDEVSTGSIEQMPGGVSVEPTARKERLTSTICSSIAAVDSNHGIDTRLEHAREKIKDLEEELLESKLDLSDRDASVIALERELSSLRAARKLRDEQSEFPIEELIARNLNLEKRLLAELKIREDGTKFTTLVATSREWFGTTKVDEGFCDVYGQSRQTLCRRDNETVSFIPSLVECDDLRKLVSKCLAISTEAPQQLQKAMCELSVFSPEAVVRSLITSALAEWVFETDFPKFDEYSSEVLAKYRELLATQDGVVTLRNLDLAARAALTKSNIFRQQKIPETAKALAIRLSQALAPLFSDTPERTEESDWDGFATWRDDKEEWMDRRKRFTQMFKFALETKADSCLNIQDYEMLIYPPGTRFDKRTMEVETRACMKDTANNHDGRVVELCMEAAVFAHRRKTLSEDSSIAEAIVTSGNFVKVDEKDRVGIEPAVKAVVILSDKQ